MKLINNQEQIVNDIFNALKDKKLFNIPTGAGKTYILLYVAKMAMEQLGKKVIISTPTNSLVRDMYHTAIENGFGEDIKIRIGIKNYIDYSMLQFYYNSGELETYITKETLEKYMLHIENIDKNELYIDVFEDIVVFTDIAYSKIVRELIVKKRIDNSDDRFANITVTNHFYLMSLLMKKSAIMLDDFVVLMDEVHQIAEVAETILTKRFSLFGMRSHLYMVMRELQKSDDFVGKLAFQKNINTMAVAINKLFRRIKNSTMSGEYLVGEQAHNLFYQLQKTMSIEVVEKIKSQISKNSKYINKDKLSSVLSEINEYNSINSAAMYNINTVTVQFTPSYGYPTFNSLSANPLGELNRVFWKKLGLFAGVSATITSSFRPTINELRYGFGRIGLASEDRDYDITFYPKVFPKEQVSIFTPNADDIPEYVSVYDVNFTKDYSQYYRYIAKYIYENNENKNSIVLCGGYLEANYLATLYKEMFQEDKNIIIAETTKTVQQTVKQFRENGGMLFATRNYNTGLSLEGSTLEKLFILRLPYPTMSSVRWLNLKNKNRNAFLSNLKSEMLITLSQAFGRLQRTKSDAGDIYLLDSRYHTDKTIKKRIDAIIDYYGIHRQQKEKVVLQKIDTEKAKNSLISKALLYK